MNVDKVPYLRFNNTVSVITKMTVYLTFRVVIKFQ